MVEDGAFSREQLDQMLKAGKISWREYERMRETGNDESGKGLSELAMPRSSFRRSLLRWYLARVRGGEPLPLAMRLTAAVTIAGVGWIAVLWVVPQLAEALQETGTELPGAVAPLHALATGVWGTVLIAAVVVLGALGIPLVQTRLGRRRALRVYITAITLFLLYALVALWLTVFMMPTALA